MITYDSTYTAVQIITNDPLLAAKITVKINNELLFLPRRWLLEFHQHI